MPSSRPPSPPFVIGGQRPAGSSPRTREGVVDQQQRHNQQRDQLEDYQDFTAKIIISGQDLCRGAEIESIRQPPTRTADWPSQEQPPCELNHQEPPPRRGKTRAGFMLFRAANLPQLTYAKSDAILRRQRRRCQGPGESAPLKVSAPQDTTTCRPGSRAGTSSGRAHSEAGQQTKLLNLMIDAPAVCELHRRGHDATCEDSSCSCWQSHTRRPPGPPAKSQVIVCAHSRPTTPNALHHCRPASGAASSVFSGNCKFPKRPSHLGPSPFGRARQRRPRRRRQQRNSKWKQRGASESINQVASEQPGSSRELAAAASGSPETPPTGHPVRRTPALPSCVRAESEQPPSANEKKEDPDHAPGVSRRHHDHHLEGAVRHEFSRNDRQGPVPGRYARHFLLHSLSRQLNGKTALYRALNYAKIRGKSPQSPHGQRARTGLSLCQLLKLLFTLIIVIIGFPALTPGQRRASCFESNPATPRRYAADTRFDLFPLPGPARDDDDLFPTSAGPSKSSDFRRSFSKRESPPSPARPASVLASGNGTPSPDKVDPLRAAAHLNDTSQQVTSSQQVAQVSSDNQHLQGAHEDQQRASGPPAPAYKWYMPLPVILMFVGATGNILVCMAVLRERRLQTATNYFLLSLACADLLVCTLVMPFGIIYEFYGRWPFDWRICNLWVTCDVLTCSSSILHMCCISVGRYMGIRNPLHARQANLFVSRRAVLWRIAIAWIASVFITSPITLMSVHNHANIVPAPGQCAIANKSFMVFGSLFAFFIPMFVMVPSYVMTVRLLSRRAKFVRNDSILMAANQDSTSTAPAAANGFVVRAKASSAGDCQSNCNTRTRGLSSADLETGAPSVGVTGGGRPPPPWPPVAEVLRRSQKNFWAGLLVDVNNNNNRNNSSEKDNLTEQQQQQVFVDDKDQADASNQRPPDNADAELKQPLLPPVKLLEESLKSCRFIDDEECESPIVDLRDTTVGLERRDSHGSQSDCSSAATIVERDANQVNGSAPVDWQTKERNLLKSHDGKSRRCGPRNACTGTAARTPACPAKRRRAASNCTSASALDGRTRCTLARCAARSSALALAGPATVAAGKAHGARRALWPVENEDARDEGARSQSCTTCSLLDIDGDSPKRPRRCSSCSSTAVNGHSRRARAGNHNEHENDKFDDQRECACEPPLTTSGQTNDSINNINIIVGEQSPPSARHKVSPCSKSCACLHTNGYASLERQQKRANLRPQTIMPAVALKDHCLARDSATAIYDENKIHHSNYPEESDNQSSGPRCHKDNGTSPSHRNDSCSSHHHHHHHRRRRRTPSRSHASCGDALAKCTISCTMCTNRVRANQHHQQQQPQHHRHRRQSQEHSRPVCLCANKRRGSPASGNRSARVQHAHRKSPSSRTTAAPGTIAAPDREPQNPVPPASLVKINEDKEDDPPKGCDEENSASDHGRHSGGGSVIFKKPTASGEKQPESEDKSPHLLASINKRKQQVTGNEQLARANHHHHLLQQQQHHAHPHAHHQGQRAHGGREPPQMIRYLGSSMQVHSEQKATRVLGGVFFFFIVCWTPFFFSNFLSGILERDLLSQYIPDGLMTCFLWLGYSSSTVNPIIYTVANRNFRRAFVRLLLCREPVSRRQYRQSRSSEYYKSFRFGQYPTVRQPVVVLDKE